MQKNLKKGFTLIELLVVIAIIGILAAVILANLGNARSSAKDGAVKSQLANIRAQMELYAQMPGNNSSYGSASDCTTGTTAFTTPNAGNGVADLIAGIVSDGSTAQDCVANGTTWAVSASLPSDNTNLFWCVDSAGASRLSTIDTTSGLCS